MSANSNRLIATIIFCLCTYVCIPQNKTILLMRDKLPYRSQTWFYSSELDKAKIKGYWDKSKRITSAAYTRDGWLLTMSNNSGIGMQTYYYDGAYPGDWIKSKWDEDYYITSIASSREKWLVVMSKGVNYTGQRYKKSSSYDELKLWYNKNRDAGYFVTAADYTGSEWFLVMSKTSDILSQGYFYADSYNDLVSKIKTKVFDNHRNIHLIEYGDGSYVVYYGKSRTGGRQCYVSNPSSLEGFIKPKIRNL